MVTSDAFGRCIVSPRANRPITTTAESGEIILNVPVWA